MIFSPFLSFLDNFPQSFNLGLGHSGSLPFNCTREIFYSYNLCMIIDVVEKVYCIHANVAV